MANGKTTISEIASALGVSIVSVSRALSEQPGVSEELKNKILEKARELGYIRNKKTEQPKILVLYQQTDSQISGSSNIGDKLQSIGMALQVVNAYYHIEFIDKSSQNNKAMPYNLTQGHSFDGAILIGNFNVEYANLIKEKIKYILFFTNYSPSSHFDCVWYDFNRAGYQACQYLIQNGHREIGFFGNKALFRNTQKIFGITDALKEHQLPCNQRLFVDYSENYQESILELVKSQNPPTAFICDYDLTALELIKILHPSDIKVPQDISIIGSGNTEISNLSIPALTTFDVNIQYACQVAIETLFKRINCPEKPYENIAILSDLVERDSVKKINV